jgi:penicillin-binding protein 1A
MSKNNQAAQAGRPSRARRVWGTIGKVIGTMVLVLFLTALVFTCLFALYIKNDLSDQVDFTVEGFALDQTSVIYYTDPATGEDVVLQKLYSGENRTWVKYDKIPGNLVKACVAIEDKRFFDHQGVDWYTTMKACVKMFLGTGTAGGSTITQQLVKNLTGEEQVTVRRKIVEIFRALALEKKYTKENILEMYLNIIYLGEKCYGVQSASQVYFGKNVEDLDLAESASLIGITNNPSIYDPYINPDKNKARQVVILDEMLKQGKISQAEHDAAVAEKLVFRGADSRDEHVRQHRRVLFLLCRPGHPRRRERPLRQDRLRLRHRLQDGHDRRLFHLLHHEPRRAERRGQGLRGPRQRPQDEQLPAAPVRHRGHRQRDRRRRRALRRRGQEGGQPDLRPRHAEPAVPRLDDQADLGLRARLELGLITPASVYDDTPYSSSRIPELLAQATPTRPTAASSRSTTAVGLNRINTVAVKVVGQDLTPEYCYSTSRRTRWGCPRSWSDNEAIERRQVNYSDVEPRADGPGRPHERRDRARDMAAAYAAFADEGVYREARTYTKVQGQRRQTPCWTTRRRRRPR